MSCSAHARCFLKKSINGTKHLKDAEMQPHYKYENLSNDSAIWSQNAILKSLHKEHTFPVITETEKKPWFYLMYMSHRNRTRNWN